MSEEGGEGGGGSPGDSGAETSSGGAGDVSSQPSEAPQGDFSEQAKDTGQPADTQQSEETFCKGAEGQNTGSGDNQVQKAESSIETAGMDRPGNEAMNSSQTREFVSNEFPPEHTNGLTFNYDGSRTGDEMGRKGELHPNGEVTIYAQERADDGTTRSTDSDAMQDTIRHEVGHNVYDECLTNEQQNEWNEQAANHLMHEYPDDPERQAAAEEVFVRNGDINEASLHARDVNQVHHDIQEDFANAYRDYLDGTLEKDEERSWMYDYMKKNVFKDNE